jgi:hypothetical protein
MGGGGGITPYPNAVKIERLFVYYKDGSISDSLPMTPAYEPNTKNYTVVVEDASKEFLTVDTEGTANTKIKIKYKFGTMKDFAGTAVSTQAAAVSNIGVPADGIDTEIQVEYGGSAWSGNEAPTGTIIVKVTTPTPTLEGLSVRYTSEKDDDTKELIRYAKNQNDYTITAKKATPGTTDNKITIKPVKAEGLEMTVTLKDSKDKSETPQTAVDGVFEIEPDAAGGYDKLVEIKVKYAEKPKENVYSVKLVPPASSTPVGYNLTDLKISYNSAPLPSGDNNKITFNSTVRKYTLTPKPVDSAIHAFFTATSDAGSTITVTYTGHEGNVTGGTASVSGNVAIPDSITGQRTLKFKVARDDGNSAEWSVTINIPAETEDWTGTIRYNGSESGFEIQGLIIMDEDGKFQVGGITQTANPKVANFEINAPVGYTPKKFLVQVTDNEGSSMQSIPLTPVVSQSSTDVIISSKSQLTYLIESANSFYNKLNAQANKEVGGYSLLNDIDLNDYKVNGVKALWNGPVGFSGNFYGNGYTIEGLDLVKTSGATGLFSSLQNGAVVQDFYVKVSTPVKKDLTGNIDFAGVVGQVSGKVTLKNITVSGNLNYGNVPNVYIMMGGLVGRAATTDDVDLTIENCVSDIHISIDSTIASGWGKLIGFFVGTAGGKVTIRKCLAGGSLTFNENAVVTPSCALIGEMRPGYSGSGTEVTSLVTVEEVCVTGNVNGIPAVTTQGSQTGTIVGYMNFNSTKTLNINNCAVTGIRTMLDGAKQPHLLKGPHFGTTPTVNYNNNFVISQTPVNAAGAANSNNGYALTESDFKQVAKWTNLPAAGGLGWSADTWDFDGLSKSGADFYWPRLK